MTISHRWYDPFMSEVHCVFCFELCNNPHTCTHIQRTWKPKWKQNINSHILQTVISKTAPQTCTPTLTDAKCSHIRNILTHMHKQPLALRDSFLNFCPLSTSCSVTLGQCLSVCLCVREAERQRNAVCDQHFSHNLSAMFVRQGPPRPSPLAAY